MFTTHEKALLINLIEEKIESTIEALSQTKHKNRVDHYTERMTIYKELLEKVLED